MKIAILFGDNDFYHTFYGVLEAIKNARKRNSSIIEDKVELCKIINELSYGMYRLYQNTHECDDEKNKKTKEYLQITSEQILLNEEVTEYLKEVDWNNSDTFIYDSDLDYENNISIFSV
jgi:hypothetical protein